MRRLVFIASLLLTGLFLGLWFASAGRVGTVMKVDTSVRRDDAVAAGTLGAWSIDVVTLAAEVSGGVLTLRRSLFTSLHDDEPTPEEVAAFAGNDGWHTVSASTATRPPEKLQRTFFDSPTNWRFMGLGLFESAGGASTHKSIEAPLWLLALLSFTPAAWIVRRALRRRKRIRRGLCVYCGYDVSKAMLVCPECGKDLVKA